eukprot:snap_masked-scaffold_55-processed-gene-0.38-mRNA-1 protein AED:1.00 eAED:1.00 QI:0/0/0/0/1/1/2/0/1777
MIDSDSNGTSSADSSETDTSTEKKENVKLKSSRTDFRIVSRNFLSQVAKNYSKYRYKSSNVDLSSRKSLIYGLHQDKKENLSSLKSFFKNDLKGRQSLSRKDLDMFLKCFEIPGTRNYYRSFVIEYLLFCDISPKVSFRFLNVISEIRRLLAVGTKESTEIVNKRKSKALRKAVDGNIFGTNGAKIFAKGRQQLTKILKKAHILENKVQTLTNALLNADTDNKAYLSAKKFIQLNIDCGVSLLNDRSAAKTLVKGLEKLQVFESKDMMLNKLNEKHRINYVNYLNLVGAPPLEFERIIELIQNFLIMIRLDASSNVAKQKLKKKISASLEKRRKHEKAEFISKQVLFKLLLENDFLSEKNVKEACSCLRKQVPPNKINILILKCEQAAANGKVSCKKFLNQVSKYISFSGEDEKVIVSILEILDPMRDNKLKVTSIRKIWKKKVDSFSLLNENEVDVSKSESSFYSEDQGEGSSSEGTHKSDGNISETSYDHANFAPDSIVLSETELKHLCKKLRLFLKTEYEKCKGKTFVTIAHTFVLLFRSEVNFSLFQRYFLSSNLKLCLEKCLGLSNNLAGKLVSPFLINSTNHLSKTLKVDAYHLAEYLEDLLVSVSLLKPKEVAEIMNCISILVEEGKVKLSQLFPSQLKVKRYTCCREQVLLHTSSALPSIPKNDISKLLTAASLSSILDVEKTACEFDASRLHIRSLKSLFRVARARPQNTKQRSFARINQNLCELKITNAQTLQQHLEKASSKFDLIILTCNFLIPTGAILRIESIAEVFHCCSKQNRITCPMTAECFAKEFYHQLSRLQTLHPNWEFKLRFPETLKMSKFATYGSFLTGPAILKSWLANYYGNAGVDARALAQKNILYKSREYFLKILSQTVKISDKPTSVSEITQMTVHQVLCCEISKFTSKFISLADLHKLLKVTGVRFSYNRIRPLLTVFDIEGKKRVYIEGFLQYILTALTSNMESSLNQIRAKYSKIRGRLLRKIEFSNMSADINLNALCEALRLLGFDTNPDSELLINIFDIFDVNNTGTLEEREFLRLVEPKVSITFLERKLRKSFKILHLSGFKVETLLEKYPQLDNQQYSVKTFENLIGDLGIPLSLAERSFLVSTFRIDKNKEESVQVTEFKRFVRGRGKLIRVGKSNGSLRVKGILQDAEIDSGTKLPVNELQPPLSEKNIEPMKQPSVSILQPVDEYTPRKYISLCLEKVLCHEYLQHVNWLALDPSGFPFQFSRLASILGVKENAMNLEAFFRQEVNDRNIISVSDIKKLQEIYILRRLRKQLKKDLRRIFNFQNNSKSNILKLFSQAVNLKLNNLRGFLESNLVEIQAEDVSSCLQTVLVRFDSAVVDLNYLVLVLIRFGRKTESDKNVELGGFFFGVSKREIDLFRSACRKIIDFVLLPALSSSTEAFLIFLLPYSFQTETSCDFRKNTFDEVNQRSHRLCSISLFMIKTEPSPILDIKLKKKRLNIMDVVQDPFLSLEYAVLNKGSKGFCGKDVKFVSRIGVPNIPPDKFLNFAIKRLASEELATFFPINQEAESTLLISFLLNVVWNNKLVVFKYAWSKIGLPEILAMVNKTETKNRFLATISLYYGRLENPCAFKGIGGLGEKIFSARSKLLNSSCMLQLRISTGSFYPGINLWNKTSQNSKMEKNRATLGLVFSYLIIPYYCLDILVWLVSAFTECRKKSRKRKVYRLVLNFIDLCGEISRKKLAILQKGLINCERHKLPSRSFLKQVYSFVRKHYKGDLVSSNNLGEKKRIQRKNEQSEPGVNIETQ